MKKIQIKKYSAALKAVYQQARLHTLILLEDGPMLIKDVQKILKVEPTLYSHHSAYLEKMGYIKKVRKGKSVLLSLTSKAPLMSKMAKSFGVK